MLTIACLGVGLGGPGRAVAAVSPALIVRRWTISASGNATWTICPMASSAELRRRARGQGEPGRTHNRGPGRCRRYWRANSASLEPSPRLQRSDLAARRSSRCLRRRRRDGCAACAVPGLRSGGFLRCEGRAGSCRCQPLRRTAGRKRPFHRAICSGVLSTGRALLTSAAARSSGPTPCSTQSSAPSGTAQARRPRPRSTRKSRDSPRRRAGASPGALRVHNRRP